MSTGGVQQAGSRRRDPTYLSRLARIPIGVAVVDLVTGRLRDQWAHVVVAGLVGAVAGWLLFKFEYLGMTLGGATAFGRAAVIPWSIDAGQLWITISLGRCDVVTLARRSPQLGELLLSRNVRDR